MEKTRQWKAAFMLQQNEQMVWNCAFLLPNTRPTRTMNIYFNLKTVSTWNWPPLKFMTSCETQEYLYVPGRSVKVRLHHLLRIIRTSFHHRSLKATLHQSVSILLLLKTTWFLFLNDVRRYISGNLATLLTHFCNGRQFLRCFNLLKQLEQAYG